MIRLKITGGNLKGRSFFVPENRVARYTSSKVRQAIFDIIGSPEGLKVLDLFAGSGSFTMEALSRGAAFATSVENNKEMLKALNKNLGVLSLDKDCLVLNMDVRYAIPFLYKKACNYDIIFIDPPYEKGLALETMQLFKNSIIYDKNTLFILEYSKRDFVDGLALNGWDKVTTKRYGDTAISIMKMLQVI